MTNMTTLSDAALIAAYERIRSGQHTDRDEEVRSEMRRRALENGMVTDGVLVFVRSGGDGDLFRYRSAGNRPHCARSHGVAAAGARIYRVRRARRQVEDV